MSIANIQDESKNSKIFISLCRWQINRSDFPSATNECDFPPSFKSIIFTNYLLSTRYFEFLEEPLKMTVLINVNKSFTRTNLTVFTRRHIINCIKNKKIITNPGGLAILNVK